MSLPYSSPFDRPPQPDVAASLKCGACGTVSLTESGKSGDVMAALWRWLDTHAERCLA